MQEGGKPEKGDPQEPERLPEDAVIATAKQIADTTDRVRYATLTHVYDGLVDTWHSIMV